MNVFEMRNKIHLKNMQQQQDFLNEVEQFKKGKEFLILFMATEVFPEWTKKNFPELYKHFIASSENTPFAEISNK